MAEVRESVVIVNAKGLHARASAKFVNTVAMLPEGLRVKVHHNGAEAGGNSILGLMMLGAAKGSTVEIVVDGEGAEGALAKVAGLVKDGFGED